MNSPEGRILTVTQLNSLVKAFLDNLPPLAHVSVKGEISNLTLHKSGHIYLTLKDKDALVKAVMFRSDAEELKFRPENGMTVVATGRVTAYVRDGVYQLYINSMEREGLGTLYEQFEALKKKLDSEGLFDPAHKKRLPPVPFSVGVITAPTGAAVRDIINIASRRFPLCELVVYPSLVQGQGAAAQLIEGLRYFNRTRRVELIILGRGGGSMEDLWAFNDEALAHAVYESELPVVSAVGHEIDFTITDFVADLRAPTPSAAAELALPDKNELLQKFQNVNRRNALSLARRIENEKRVFGVLRQATVLREPRRMFDDRRLYLTQLEERLQKAAEADLLKKRDKIRADEQLLRSFDPLGVLKRGYAAAFAPDGSVVKSVSALPVGACFTLRLADGDLAAKRIKEKDDE